MFSEIAARLRSLNRIAFAASMALWVLQPLGARADQCDDAWAAFQRSTPETSAATARSIPKFDFSGDVEQRQKALCDADKGIDDLNRLTLDGIRRVEQACGGRRKLVCNVACQEKALAESQKKSAYDCSPATLEDVRRTDQAEKNQQDAQFKADMDVQKACIEVVSTNAFPDLPHDSEYKKNVKLCNANPAKCKYVRENLNDQKWPSDLTCGR